MNYRKRFVSFGLLISLVGCASQSEQKDSENVLNQPDVEIKEELAQPEPGARGVNSDIILNNEPTKQVLTALESVADTLNVLSLGIFAGSRL